MAPISRWLVNEITVWFSRRGVTKRIRRAGYDIADCNCSILRVEMKLLVNTRKAVLALKLWTFINTRSILYLSLFNILGFVP